MNEKIAAEEAWIMKQEKERMKELQAIREEKVAEEEKARLKELHHMRCPKCGGQMVEVEYEKNGEVIHIDKCGVCSSVTLDDGELEQILKLNASTLSRLFKF